MLKQGPGIEEAALFTVVAAASLSVENPQERKSIRASTNYQFEGYKRQQNQAYRNQRNPKNHKPQNFGQTNTPANRMR